MKYYIIIFLFFSSFIYSQSEVGLRIIDIKNRYKESKYNLKESIEDDGSTSLSVKLGNAYATYYFDNDTYKLSNTLVITPDNQSSLEKYINLYNSKYKRANSTNVKWIVETVSIVEYIHLSKMSAGGKEFYVLIWSFDD
jgi:hypothetical protein